MKIRTILLASLLALPVIASADATKPSPTAAAALSDGDTAILAHQHAVNTMEIDMGTIASKSANVAVRSYGNLLVKDHKSADKDLAAMAKKKGVATIPADVPPTDAEKADQKMDQDMMANLKTLKGKELDAALIKMAVDGHTKEIGKVDAAMGTVSDADLKAYLAKVKPVMQKHEDAAKKLQGKS